MILFKTERLEDEFEKLKTENPKLRSILHQASLFIKHEFNKDMVITELFRTKEENAALYKHSAQPLWRPHTQWMGADLRSSIYTQAEIQKLLTYFNLFQVFNGQRKCASYHMIAGNVYHFHVQSDKGSQQWANPKPAA